MERIVVVKGASVEPEQAQGNSLGDDRDIPKQPQVGRLSAGG